MKTRMRKCFKTLKWSSHFFWLWVMGLQAAPAVVAPFQRNLQHIATRHTCAARGSGFCMCVILYMSSQRCYTVTQCSFSLCYCFIQWEKQDKMSYKTVQEYLLSHVLIFYTVPYCLKNAKSEKCVVGLRCFFINDQCSWLIQKWKVFYEQRKLHSFCFGCLNKTFHNAFKWGSWWPSE